MKYLGGKTRQAKWIRDHIRRLRGSRTRYVEPFVGGGSVLAAVAPDFTEVDASDAVPDLVALWQALVSGWDPPATISREDYEALRAAEPSAMRAWAGYAASYNSKWWGGYGPTAGTRDYLAENRRGALKKAAAFPHARLACRDYAESPVDRSCVVYCDPPYANTTGYSAVGAFDHDRFWRVCQAWVSTGALVLVTEYTAPPDWYALDYVDRVETMSHGPSSGSRRETLYCADPLAVIGITE